MTEWRILVSGIRTIGLFFFARGLTDSSPYFSMLFLASSSGAIYLAYAFLQIVFALALIRSAPAIASRIMEPPDDGHATRSENRNWDRWLFSSAVVCAIALSWPQSIFNGLGNVALTPYQSENLELAIFGFLLTVGVELTMLTIAIVTIFRRPQWILGRSNHGTR